MVNFPTIDDVDKKLASLPSLPPKARQEFLRGFERGMAFAQEDRKEWDAFAKKNPHKATLPEYFEFVRSKKFYRIPSELEKMANYAQFPQSIGEKFGAFIGLFQYHGDAVLNLSEVQKIASAIGKLAGEERVLGPLTSQAVLSWDGVMNHRLQPKFFIMQKLSPRDAQLAECYKDTRKLILSALSSF